MALQSPLSIGPAGPAGTAKQAHLLLPSGPAGALLEDILACFALQAQGPSRCHAESMQTDYLVYGSQQA